MWVVPTSPSTPPWPVGRSSPAGPPKSRFGLLVWSHLCSCNRGDDIYCVVCVQQVFAPLKMNPKYITLLHFRYIHVYICVCVLFVQV